MRNRLKKALRRIRLRTQLSIMFVALSSIPIMLSSIFTYTVVKGEMIRLAQNNLTENIRKSNHIIDTQLSMFESASDQLNVAPGLLEVFSKLDTEDGVSLIQANRKIKDILRQYIPIQGGQYSVHLVTSYYPFGEEGKNFYPLGSLANSGIAQVARNGDSSLVWIPTYDYMEMFSINNLTTEQLEYGRLFSAVRQMNISVIQDGSIRHLDGNKEQPTLLINFKEDYLLSLLHDYSSDPSYIDSSSLLIATQEGEIVCSSLKDHGGNEGKWLQQIPQGKTYGSMVTTLDGEEYVVAYSLSDVTGWVTALLLPSASFMNVVMYRVMLMITVMTITFAIVSLFFSYLISERFSRKILQTLKVIEQVGEGDFDTKLQYDEEGELAFFYERLNWMEENIKRLIYENYEVKLRQKDSEIMILNIQLNPHFLYNTLNIINWLCLEEKAYHSSDIIVKLSRMLQYTSDNSQELSILRDDIEWIRQYVDIMSIRYENKFTVEYDIDVALLEMQVPKLFLQPLIENAIIHGFRDMHSGGKLLISGMRFEEEVLFYVEDNGVGMEAVKMQSVMKYETSSIGIRNTDKRIKMLYGDQYGIRIYSEPQSRTVMTIALPV